jgi:two-component system CheB/CheR fusion protein
VKRPAAQKRKKRQVPLQRHPSEQTPQDKAKPFPIVGIGASAGGLEAFSNLLAHLPPKTGMAFVFVQHLDPSHSSALEEILSRATKIPVREVRDGLAVQPDHIYIIPPNADMLIKQNVLSLSARTVARGQHRPIDTFLRSLAEDKRGQAIGVILSGTAADGSAGCAAIKAGGGITFAQDENTAKYSSMPRSAVGTGCIDFVLSPEAIAEELVRIGKHPYIARATKAGEEPQVSASTDDLKGLFGMIREAKSVDFTHYKQSTLSRRIKRRMVLNHIEKLKDYLSFVKDSPNELEELYRDILINVTGFFRDPGAFEALRKEVFPNLLGNRKAADDPIRIWIPACSTGEEAYSIAIELLEAVWSDGGSKQGGSSIQIFATDISDDALDRARAGTYTEAAVADVSPDRLKRFFVRIDGSFQVNKLVREACIFARQNVTKDPPFSNLDLISCRNLLIYLGPELQKRVIPMLHYGLKPNGYLMVGTAESLSSYSDHFTLIDKKYRIYQKKKTASRLITYFMGVDYSSRRSEAGTVTKAAPLISSIDKEVDRLLVNRFVPASIVVNSEMEIVQFRGKTGAYLEPATGQPTFSLSKMVREGLLVDLLAAINQVKKQNLPARRTGVVIQSDSDTRQVDLEVIPLQGGGSQERFYVVIFQEPSRERAAPARRERPAQGADRKGTSSSRKSDQLKSEIRVLRDQMQSLIEDHEMTSEEFKTANEEVLSANEELQSTNEELETTKEELQSSNEELTTLNEEVQNRNAELSLINSDLVNLFSNANVPVVMVSDALRIRRFTSPAEKMLNLIPADIGRRLGEIRANINVDLEQVARDTIEQAALHEQEVRDNAGTWYLMRARPYKTLDNRLDGAVISFHDIDKLKHTLEETKLYADTVIETAREPILVLDKDLRVVVANPAFYTTFKQSKAETENQLLHELGNRQWNIPRLLELLGEVIGTKSRIDDYQVRHVFPQLGERTMILNARRIEPEQGRSLIILSIEDITERTKQVDMLVRQGALLELVRDAIIMRDLDGKILHWNRGAQEMYGWKQQEALGKTTHEILQTQFPMVFHKIEEELRRTGHWEGELLHTRRDGQRIFVSSRWALLEQNDEPPMILEINTNVTERKEAEDRLRQLSGHLMRVQDEERRRIARELHDSTGQKLAAAKLQIDTLARHAELKAHQASLLEGSELVDEAFQEIRTLSQLLHPPLLDETGLVSATRWMVEGFSNRAKIPVEFQVSGEVGRLPQPVELALFRVTQECLNNIRRHADAKLARVELARTDDTITLQVHDNGKGMPPDLLSSADGKQVMGVGILGMKERLSQLGGTLEIESGKDGTTVRAVLPNRKAASSTA